MKSSLVFLSLKSNSCKDSVPQNDARPPFLRKGPGGWVVGRPLVRVSGPSSRAPGAFFPGGLLCPCLGWKAAIPQCVHQRAAGLPLRVQTGWRLGASPTQGCGCCPVGSTFRHLTWLEQIWVSRASMIPEKPVFSSVPSLSFSQFHFTFNNS